VFTGSKTVEQLMMYIKQYWGDDGTQLNDRLHRKRGYKCDFKINGNLLRCLVKFLYMTYYNAGLSDRAV
jgi:hypothetical protein